MLYIITLIFFLIWSIFVIYKGRMSWHAVITIYVISVFISDYGDVPFEFWFNFYDLQVHLLNNLDVGRYLGIILSDGLIFPFIAIIFCYYSVRFDHPWLLSILFAAMLGILEFLYVKLGYMVYYHWNHWLTPLITFITLRIVACFSNRLVHYSPPISYRFRLLCSIYVITEWPGAILCGSLRLYQYKPNIFNNETANDRFVAMILATLMGVLAAFFISKISSSYKIFLFLGLGLVSSIFAVYMHSKELLIYNHWNSVATVIRYIAPYFVVYLYDRWEASYTRHLHH